jgi:hypothetical protein
LAPKKKTSKKFIKPKYCDLYCSFAAWPEENGLDGSGSCRTFLAVYCRKLKKVVHKNGPCQA